MLPFCLMVSICYESLSPTFTTGETFHFQQFLLEKNNALSQPNLIRCSWSHKSWLWLYASLQSKYLQKTIWIVQVCRWWKEEVVLINWLECISESLVGDQITISIRLYLLSMGLCTLMQWQHYLIACTVFHNYKVWTLPCVTYTHLNNR